jgi:hypothetical protein
MGPVGYLTTANTTPTREQTSPEQLTAMARLCSGKRGIEVLAREGSLELGLGLAIGWGVRASDKDWGARSDAFKRGLATALKQADATGVMRHVMADSMAALPEHFRRAGSMLEEMKDWSCVRESITPMLARISGRLAHWNRPPTDRAGAHPFAWMLDRIESTIQASGEPSEEELQHWLPGLVFLLSGVESTHPVYQRVLGWMGQGAEPAWASDDMRENARKLLAGVHPSLEATIRSIQLDGALRAAAAARLASRPRM